MDNKTKFQIELEKQYINLFKTPAYKFIATRTTPFALAEKMTKSLVAGTGDKEGEGVKMTCKQLGIKCTCKAIKEYLEMPKANFRSNF